MQQQQQPARLPVAAAAAAAAANPAAAPSPDEMARRWLAMDNDPASRAAVEALLEKGDAAALSALFCSRLEFGAPQKRGLVFCFALFALLDLGALLASTGEGADTPNTNKTLPPPANTTNTPSKNQTNKGTAGLRGKMGPGFSRMNLITVIQSTQGLCRYLQAELPDVLASGGVLIGACVALVFFLR
jgi:hypothetical protein